MSKKIFTVFLVAIIFFSTSVLQVNKVYANPLYVVGTGALKLFGGVAVKGGVKAGSKKALEKGTKHSVKKLTQDGKVVSPAQWVKTNKTKPTQTAFGGKFLKYTLGTGAILSLASLSSDSIQNLPTNPDMTKTYDYSDYWTEPDVEGINFDVTTSWKQVDYKMTSTSFYLGVTFYNLMLQAEQTVLVAYQGNLNGGFRTDRSSEYMIYDVQPSPFENKVMVKFMEVNSGALYIEPIGHFLGDYVTTEEFFPDVRNLVPGEAYSYLEDISTTDLDAQTKTPEEIVPDVNAPETEIFIPNNPDALEQIRQNPDIMTNPEKYVDSVPEGQPESNKDIDGDPILDEAGNPLPEPSPEPNPGEPPGDGGETEPKKMNLEPLKVALGSLKDIFPFSIPWDVYALFSKLNVEPKTPVFDFDIERTISILGVSIPIDYDFTVDFSTFDPIAKIFRWGLVLVFDIAIIMSLRRLTPD